MYCILIFSAAQVLKAVIKFIGVVFSRRMAEILIGVIAVGRKYGAAPRQPVISLDESSACDYKGDVLDSKYNNEDTINSLEIS
jgi:hypothetical protein